MIRAISVGGNRWPSYVVGMKLVAGLCVMLREEWSTVDCFPAVDSTVLGCFVGDTVDGGRGVDEQNFESYSEIASLPTSFHWRSLLTEEQWDLKGDSGKDAAGVVQFVFDSQMSKAVESLVAAGLSDNSGSCLNFF